MKYSKYLKDNEELIQLVRSHPAVYFKPAAIAITLLLLPFFLMFLLFRWETPGLIVFIALLIIGLIAIIKLVIIWNHNIFLITNKRVMLFKQPGMFERQVYETEYENIQDVSYRVKGAAQTVFRYGSVRIQIANSDFPIIVSKISKPRDIQQLLLKIKKNQKNSEKV